MSGVSGSSEAADALRQALVADIRKLTEYVQVQNALLQRLSASCRDESYEMMEYLTKYADMKLRSLMPEASQVCKQLQAYSDFINKIETGNAVTDIAKGYTLVRTVNQKLIGKAPEVLGVVNGFTLIKTINQKLVGKAHEVTGVKFKLSTVELSDGRKIMGVFPVFDSFSDIQLPEELYKASFDEQKKYCLEQLQIKCAESSLRENFTDEQLEDIANGILPEGFTWHHNEKEGLMQLVDTLTHDKTAHTGGMSLWGRGY